MAVGRGWASRKALIASRKGFTGAIPGAAGIFDYLGKGFRGVNGAGSIGHFTAGIETGVAGNDRSSRVMGALHGRDDGAERIQCSLDGGGVPAFLVGFIDQGLYFA